MDIQVQTMELDIAYEINLIFHFADARFMLIACSAFVNYLVSKADDATIQFS